jgi:hypothetical protein
MLSDTPEPLGAIDDDRLRLVFTCCHSALGVEARVALTLRVGPARPPRRPTSSAAATNWPHREPYGRP